MSPLATKECLVHYLYRWAEAEALTDFVYDTAQPQAWFASESMLFAAAMAYSIVRPFIDGLEEERADIEQWLQGLALQHSAVPGPPQDSCCNNPAALGDYAPQEQYTGFLRDPQYFTWMEIYLSHFDHQRMASLITRARPTYSRSAGGHVTLYFMDPDAQEHIYTDERRQETEAFRGLSN